ncbi:MAG: glycosyltransferase [Cellulomonadaceae bacterium]|nr:glycosyltransferase [Cellulomonadaceae bacterium]
MATRFGLLSTFPPTQCGLATFTHALAHHLQQAGQRANVIRVVDTPQPAVPLVSHQLVTGRDGFARDAAAALNACDVAILQHEYGIFGGQDGQDVLAVLERVTVPVITVLHTVLARPTPHQHEVLGRVLEGSDVAVTMTEAGRRRVIEGWGAGPGSVVVIPHGAHDNRASDDGVPRNARPTVLTWGLLGPGKGIEWALEAFSLLTDLDPLPLYRVVGQTHPRVVEHHGEAYRDELVAQVEALGISAMVEFDARYLDVPALQATIRAADIVLLPYDSLDQVTSGVLTEAVVAGRPVISTPFPHALELLSGGAGALVPRADPEAMAAALRRVLTRPGVAASMAAEARELAPTLLWSAVAGEYVRLSRGLRSRTPSVA